MRKEFTEIHAPRFYQFDCNPNASFKVYQMWHDHAAQLKDLQTCKMWNITKAPNIFKEPVKNPDEQLEGLHESENEGVDSYANLTKKKTNNTFDTLIDLFLDPRQIRSRRGSLSSIVDFGFDSNSALNQIQKGAINFTNLS